MPTLYAPLKPIRFADLFDGRLDRYGVHEAHGSEPSQSFRGLSDGQNELGVYKAEDGNVDMIRRSGGNAPRPILSAICEAFETEIASEYEPEFWEFAPPAKWEADMGDHYEVVTLGELAVAEKFGLPPFVAGGFREADVGGVDVRTRAAHRYGNGPAALLLYDRDADDRIFILASIEGPQCALRGWIFARDGKEKCYRKIKRKGGEAYIVKPRHLKPIWDLPGLVMPSAALVRRSPS